MADDMIYPSQMSQSDYRAWQARQRRKREDAKRRGDRVPRDDPELLDYDEAARILGCTPGRVRSLCDQRKLGYIVKSWRHGYYPRRARFIPKRDLLVYMAKTYRYKPPLR